MTTENASLPLAARRWRWIGQMAAAHVVMLRDAGLIDDDALAGLLRAIDSTRLADPAQQVILLEAIRSFDERMEVLLPRGLSGTARVGRGTLDLAAAVTRAVLREDLLRFGEQINELRAGLIEMAAAHVITLLPVHVDGHVAQPTTFGHQLAGTVSQLARAADRIDDAYGVVNRSPLGSGALASTGMPIDRERLTDLLGFDGLLENTFDAVSAADHLTALADAVDAGTLPVRRHCEDLRAWVRAEPGSFRFGDEWISLLADLPQARPAVGLSALIADLKTVSGDAGAMRTAIADVPFGPIAGEGERLSRMAGELLARATSAVKRAASLLTSGMEVNRALLANRAGKGFSTSSDLADFLMIEEQIEPGPAQNIAALTISRAREQGLEAAGITPELIDGAALLVIGREIKVEFEAISRYLAPRRFIERRKAPGGPNPDAVRAHLEGERARLAQDRQRQASASDRLQRAAAELARIEVEALDSVRG